MSQINTLLSERLKKKKNNSSKTAALAQRSAQGHLSGFSGVFSISELSANEKELIEEILTEYAEDNEEIERDLAELVSITSEVKAINNQAALLHGERIKKAQEILTRYRDGAFTSWLIATYGNRQTPYNFMQYYEFYESLPSTLRPRIEMMPRQAIYTLASRDGDIKKKQEIIQGYKGQTKNELLRLIREIFPIADQDKRRRKQGELAIQELKKVHHLLTEKRARITKNQKTSIAKLLKMIENALEDL